MPTSNASETKRSLAIAEIDLVIEAYTASLDFLLQALQAYTQNEMEEFTIVRDRAYECLSTLLDGMEIQPMDLADSFRLIHMDAIRLIWSDDPKQWMTATKLLARLRSSCQQSRTQAVANMQRSTPLSSPC